MPHRYFSKEFAQGMAWLSEADSRHLCVVMRAQAGQTVTVCDGHGTDYACRLAVVSPVRAGLDILSSEKKRIGAVGACHPICGLPETG